MSPKSKAALIADLKSRIAGPESGERERSPAISLGVPQIDKALPEGGLRLGALHEIAATAYRDMGAATGFLAALTVCATRRSSGPVLWCEAGHAPFDVGRLYGPGIAAFGLDPARLILVAPRRDNDRLWVMEEALRSRAFAAVVGEMDASSASLDLTATRRLQLAAEEAETPLLLFTGYPKEGGGPSVAVSRWHVSAAPSASVPCADEEEMLPGAPRWNVALVRSRSGQPGNWLLEWNAIRGAFSVMPAAHDIHAPDATESSAAGILVPFRRTA